MELRSHQEEAIQTQAKLQQHLQASQLEVRELQDLRAQIASKEEVEERLVRENEDLASRLSVAEHQLAVGGMRSKSSREEAGEEEEEDGGGQEVEVMRELQKRTMECDSLKAQ